jgi:hypothetical protein
MKLNVLGVLALATAACTPQEAKTATQVAEVVLADADRACIWLNATLPVSEVRTACNIVGIADSVIVQAQQDFLAKRGAIAKYEEMSAAKAAKKQ